MIDFNKRSREKELLDRDDIPFTDIERNMQELEFINARLGGHAITISGIQKIIARNKEVLARSPRLSICEIGCGGGDNLAAVIKWARKKSLQVNCIGIDINPDCINYARKKNKGLDIKFICSDFKIGLVNTEKPGIIFNSLFCHHFTDNELLEVVEWMNTNAIYGSVINDLHRHPIAYHLIKMLTGIFSKSYLVKNDAPVSVLRGFKKNELENIFQKAGIKNYDIEWRWAFRWLAVLG